MSTIKDELPLEIRDQSDLIEDGLTDAIEALETPADERVREAPHGVPKRDADKAEPAPETL